MNLKDEVIAEDINNWLNEHPEATTTVQDGSLTSDKFTDDLKLHTLKDYVTPLMFGAVGDGVTDDTQAFIKAIASGKSIKVTNGTYLITSTLTIESGIVFEGYGSKSIIKFRGATFLFYLITNMWSKPIIRNLYFDGSDNSLIKCSID